jgi:hypothetical protein
MKTNHRLIAKIISVGLLTVLVVVFTQCGKNTTQIGNSTSNNSNAGGTIPMDHGQIITNTEISEGIKSHEQIFFTMSALTGVPVTTTEVRNVYNQVATSLPTDNDLKVFLPPHQLAITKLAAEFCHVLVENTTLRAQIWSSFNFRAIPSAVDGLNNPQIRATVIAQVVQAFWGGVLTEAELYAAEDELDLLMTDMLAGETNDVTTSKNVIKGVCTAALSSAHVTLL